MPRLFDDQTSLNFFSEEYSKAQSDAARRVERAVLGHEVGLEGYTTVDQARDLCARIDVRPGTRVLDVGAGRGWPGAFLARCMGCRLVFLDLPAGVLREAMERFGSGDTEAGAAAVAADGRTMPFRAGVFGAVVHADVF